jgi:hypothetical protein
MLNALPYKRAESILLIYLLQNIIVSGQIQVIPKVYQGLVTG